MLALAPVARGSPGHLDAKNVLDLDHVREVVVLDLARDLLLDGDGAALGVGGDAAPHLDGDTAEVGGRLGPQRLQLVERGAAALLGGTARRQGCPRGACA